MHYFSTKNNMKETQYVANTLTAFESCCVFLFVACVCGYFLLCLGKEIKKALQDYFKK